MQFMKMRVLLTTLAVLSTSMLAAMAMDVHWNHDVNLGMEEGKRCHKFVLVDVYTNWCGVCKRLEYDTSRDQGLSEFLSQNFVCVKANAEDHAAGEKMARQYSVNAYPSALVFDYSGKLIGKVVGYTDAADYQKSLTDIITGHQ